MQGRAEHQQPGPALAHGCRECLGHDPVLVHLDRLQVLTEPRRQAAQAAVAELLGQDRVAGAGQRQHGGGERPFGAVGEEGALRLGREAQMPQPVAGRRPVPQGAGGIGVTQEVGQDLHRRFLGSAAGRRATPAPGPVPESSR